METARTTTATATATTSNKQPRKPRKRPLPQDVTCRNLAIEKRRRQELNQIFLDLARCLPRLASTKRLSKNLIVIESVRHLQRQRDMCIAAGRELRELLSTHNDLIAELNMLRSQLQIRPQNAPRLPSTAFLSLMDVENQVYGQFPNGFERTSATEECAPQPSIRQMEMDLPLPGPASVPDLVSPVRDSAQVVLPDNLDRTHDLVHPELWQIQTPGHLFAPSNVHGVLAPDTDLWEYSATGMYPGIAPILPWEEVYDDGLPGYPEGILAPFLE